MLPEAVVTGYLLLAVVLAVAGTGSLARPGLAAAGAVTLGLPRRLARRGAARAHGLLELALAAGLLLPQPAVRWVAVTVAALLGCYLLLVAGAVARGREGECHCFGGFGASRLGRPTVARNVLLLLVGAAVAWDAGAGGSVPAHLTGSGGRAGWWLLALAVTALMVWLVAVRPAGGSAEGAPGRTRRGTGAGTPPLGDVPDVTVEVAGVPRSLRELAAERPRLLLFLSPTCGPCLYLADRLEELRDRVPDAELHVVTPVRAELLPADLAGWRRGLLVDPGRSAGDALGVTEPPAAVLARGERLVGPVHGPEAVLRLVEDAAAGRLPG